MKNILLLISFVITLSAGILSGIAYERYARREECLSLAFDNAGALKENAEILSEEEINGIVKILNEDPGINASSSSTSSDAGSGLNPGPVENNPKNSSDNYVGSRNSNKFYPADCRYAKLIKEENKVFFATVEEGEKAGRKYVECK